MTSHITWLKPAGTVSTSDGRPVQIMELVCDYSDASTWSAWARHFREHYCLDATIDLLRQGTPYSRAEYLRELVFPEAGHPLGQAVRHGDFGEILIADFIEHQLGFWIPRTRYAHKSVRNESAKGSDVLGLHFKNTDYTWSREDVLITCETKTQFTGKAADPRLQDAVHGSKKDMKRLGESLNAAKRRLHDQGMHAEAMRVSRFQDPLDRPYTQRFGAAALFTSGVFDATIIAATDASNFSKDEELLLLVVKADDFKRICAELYERAANEA